MKQLEDLSFEEKHPIILKLNTLPNARPGDYNVTFVFTYTDGQNMFQDSETTQFHVTDRWERNQAWIQIVAVIIALLSLIVGAVFSTLNYWKPRMKKISTTEDKNESSQETKEIPDD